MGKIIGILGGMGPMATADLFAKIVRLTDAPSDNDHIRIIIDNNAQIPDRTAAILHGGPDPVPAMRESARLLARAGCDAIIMPCNTAHYFIGQLQSAVSVPFINMIEETARAIAAQGVACVGLLATDGTCQTGLYDRALAACGVRTLLPEPEDQRMVMETIYQVKAQNMALPVHRLTLLAEKMRARGAAGLVLGCTELPIAFENIATALPQYDPTTILAKSAIRFAGKRVRSGENTGPSA